MADCGPLTRSHLNIFVRSFLQIVDCGWIFQIPPSILWKISMSRLCRLWKTSPYCKFLPQCLFPQNRLLQFYSVSSANEFLTIFRTEIKTSRIHFFEFVEYFVERHCGSRGKKRNFRNSGFYRKTVIFHKIHWYFHNMRKARTYGFHKVLGAVDCLCLTLWNAFVNGLCGDCGDCGHCGNVKRPEAFSGESLCYQGSPPPPSQASGAEEPTSTLIPRRYSAPTIPQSNLWKRF